jgi:hypothetical protein
VTMINERVDSGHYHVGARQRSRESRDKECAAALMSFEDDLVIGM